MAFHGRNKGFFLPPKTVKKYIDGVLVFTYEKLSHAATDFNISDATMCRYLNNKIKNKELKKPKWIPENIDLSYR